jgi:2-keto-4-pentenoate hydratase/2-oxohepta-3-ene-1,7-dioic acid hydratase in catechol pathway
MISLSTTEVQALIGSCKKFPIPPHPIVFHKSKNTVTGPTSTITIPAHCKSIDYENELCIVLSKPAKNVPAAEVLSGGYILAYTIGNDVSARDWQKRDVSGGQFCYAKSFDTFLPLGPALVHSSALEKDAADLKILTRHNGEVVQNSTTRRMIFGIPELVEFLTKGTTLPAGTLIMTGTPHGVAAFRKDPPVFIKAGDIIECEIEGLGCLKNEFSAE